MRDEETVVQISEQHLLGDLIKFVVDLVREQTTPYVALPPEEQRLLVDRIQRHCKSAVRDVVNIIASKDMPRAEAEIRSVDFRDNGIAVKLIVAKSQVARHELADAIGDTVTLVLPAWAEINAGDVPKANRLKVDTTLTLPGIPPGEGDLSQTGAARIADDLLRDAAESSKRERRPDDDEEGAT